MNKGRNHIALISTFIFTVSACLYPYQPPTILEAVDILVVDGFLDVTDGSATIRLTHANTLSDANKAEAELNASVSIQTEGGNSYTLTEQDSGTYTIVGLNVDPTAKYQLSIHTPDEDYLSDYVEIKQSPPIDSITWEAMDNGVNILVNAHDAAGSTRYYRWDYVETWQYHAAVSSDFKLVNKEPVYRTDAERIHTCWRSLPSTKITIASTVRLAEDVVYQYPIAFLPVGSNKISVKYSILVKQRAVSKSEFDFWEQLKKTTEDVGGLFDPMPSQVPGNIHSLSNPGAPVLGYFSAGAAKEERFFLDHSTLPFHLRKLIRQPGCQVDTICVVPSIPRAFICYMDLEDLTGTETIGSALYSETGPGIIGYTKSTPACADCRTQGGSLTKPAFWP